MVGAGWGRGGDWQGTSEVLLMFSSVMEVLVTKHIFFVSLHGAYTRLRYVNSVAKMSHFNMNLLNPSNETCARPLVEMSQTLLKDIKGI